MKKLSTVFFLMLMPIMSNAQTGTIKARVIDTKTGKPIYRAAVVITETKQGAFTKPDGYATIINIHPNSNYTLVAKFPGYEPKMKKEVVVKQDDTTKLTFKLKTDVQKKNVIKPKPIIENTKIVQGVRMDADAISHTPGVNNLDQLTTLTPGVVGGGSSYVISSNCNFGRGHSDPDYCTPPTRGSVMIDTAALRTAISQFAVSEFSCPTTAATQESIQQKPITITPNPSNSIIRLTFTSDNEIGIVLHVYNSRGVIVRTIRDDAIAVGDWSTTINMSDCAEGTYVVQLIQGSDVRMGRFMLLKQ